MKISEKNGVFYLDKGRLDLYSPQKYFGTINHIDGNKSEIFGLLLYKYYEKETDTKPTKVGVFNNPSMIKLYPLDIDIDISDDIWGGKYSYTNTNQYTVLHFTEGSPIMDKNIIQNLNNVMTFLDLLLGSKIDNNIPYNLLSNIWIKNLEMNEQSLGIPYSIINVIIYELCRYNKDTSKPFGSVYGKNPDMSPLAYNFISIRQACATNSIFSAITFEDMNSMLDASLNMTTKEKEQRISPIEQIIKY